MKKINTLVVGQGIAGTLVAYLLYQHDIPFTVIDPGYSTTSSRVAAGMFTPISGARKTIHPLAPLQIPFAIKTYKAIEELIGNKILHEQNIYQVHQSINEQNDLLIKSTHPDFVKYISPHPHPLPTIKQSYGTSKITHSGWVDCNLLIKGFTHWLKQNEAMIEAEFLYQDVALSNGSMKYQGLEYSHIIFCEGYRGINNPFFKNERIVACKGDLLTIQCDASIADSIIKKNGMYLIPLGNNLYRAGATYQWNNANEQPDEAAKKQLTNQLDALLKNKCTIVNHQSAIRPTTQNREVIVKQHPDHRGMFILNGLGTKGILQAPWWARELVRTMCAIVDTR